MEGPIVTLSAIQEARKRIFGIAYRTPLYYSPGLSARTGAAVYMKLECYQPIRVFKIRGAANKILQIPKADRDRGFVAASSGNHGLAISYMANRVGGKATIVVPTTAVEEKVAAIQEYGAEVVKHGLFHDQRMKKALEIQKETGCVFIHPFDDPDIIAGQGTIGLEIIEDLPDVDRVIVPIGGGGLISGISTAIKALKPSAKVIGVEPEKASSMFHSVRNNKITRLQDTSTIADGLAAREPGERTFAIVRQNVDEIQLVSEEQIEHAVAVVMKECHLTIEPSAAAAFSALLTKQGIGRGEKIAVVVSGGNISLKMLRNILDKYP